VFVLSAILGHCNPSHYERDHNGDFRKAMLGPARCSVVQKTLGRLRSEWEGYQKHRQTRPISRLSVPRGHRMRQATSLCVGLPGEGSIPVPLPPPAGSRPCILRASSLAIKPSRVAISDLSCGLPAGRTASLFSERARFSPNLWTLPFRASANALL
jgi:hypothetical protein